MYVPPFHTTLSDFLKALALVYLPSTFATYSPASCPRIGDRLELDEDMKLYKVYKSSDEACVSGICDIAKIG